MSESKEMNTRAQQETQARPDQESLSASGCRHLRGRQRNYPEGRPARCFPGSTRDQGRGQ
jgi:hypothetical protein